MWHGLYSGACLMQIFCIQNLASSSSNRVKCWPFELIDKIEFQCLFFNILCMEITMWYTIMSRHILPCCSDNYYLVVTLNILCRMHDPPLWSLANYIWCLVSALQNQHAGIHISIAYLATGLHEYIKRHDILFFTTRLKFLSCFSLFDV